MYNCLGNDGDVNCLVLTSDIFGNSLWDTVAKQIEILIKQGYQVQVYDDDVDIIVIRYAYRDEELTNYRLEWLTDEEVDYIDDLRDEHGFCPCGCCDECDTVSESTQESEYTNKQMDFAECCGETWDNLFSE